MGSLNERLAKGAVELVLRCIEICKGVGFKIWGPGKEGRP